MTNKQKVINRLNKGFGLSLRDDCVWLTHLRNGCGYGASWQIHKYTCDDPVGEALKWDRWVLSEGMDSCHREIIEYVPSMHDEYISMGWIIENE